MRILEGIVTTVSVDESINIAPMGPYVTDDMARLVFRPYQTAQTYRNLKHHGEGVFHITDDVLLLARAALESIEPQPAMFPASKVHGYVIKDACRFFEFRVDSLDDRDERTRIDATVVNQGQMRDFFGFNRAKHAVIEAAILATRTQFLPLDSIAAEFGKLAEIVKKTGGDQEQQAFEFLECYLTNLMSRPR